MVETKSKPKNNYKVIKFLSAIFIWTYIFVKLFIYDIDIYFIQKTAPRFYWIIEYKFYVLLGIFTILFLFTKNIKIITSALYFLFFPFLLIGKFFFLIFKEGNWNFIIALIDSVFTFFKEGKIKFIKTSVFLIAMFLIFHSKNISVLWISISLLTIIIVWAYIQHLIFIIKPSKVFLFYTKIVSDGGELLRNPKLKNETLEKTQSELEKMDKTELQSWVANIQVLVFFNRICLFLAKKLQSYRKSRFNTVSSIFSIIILMLFTVATFSFINFGLFKISPDYFDSTISPKFFNFIYYSYNNLLFSSIPDLIASSPISQFFSMVESFLCLFLVAILITIIFSVKQEKENQEIDDLISTLSSEGLKMESYITKKYRFASIAEVMMLLRDLNALLSEILFKVSESLE